MQADPNSEVDPDVAVAFKAGLELASIGTLLAGLAVSFWTEFHILREVTRTDDSLEHEDYKVRVEMRHMETIHAELANQEAIIERLKTEYDLLQEEKRDLDDMRHHRTDSDLKTFENPLDKDSDDVESED